MEAFENGVIEIAEVRADVVLCVDQDLPLVTATDVADMVIYDWVAL